MVFDGGSMVFNGNLINYRGGIIGINTGICKGYIYIIYIRYKHDS